MRMRRPKMPQTLEIPMGSVSILCVSLSASWLRAMFCLHLRGLGLRRNLFFPAKHLSDFQGPAWCLQMHTATIQSPLSVHVSLLQNFSFWVSSSVLVDCDLGNVFHILCLIYPYRVVCFLDNMQPSESEFSLFATSKWIFLF